VCDSLSDANTPKKLNGSATLTASGNDNRLGVAPGGVPHLRSEISDFRLRNGNNHDSSNGHDNDSLTHSRKERKAQHAYWVGLLGLHLRSSAFICGKKSFRIVPKWFRFLRSFPLFAARQKNPTGSAAMT
jgi:hypothetical protein